MSDSNYFLLILVWFPSGAEILGIFRVSPTAIFNGYDPSVSRGLVGEGLEILFWLRQPASLQ